MKKASCLTIMFPFAYVNMHAELRYYVAPNGSDNAKGTINDPFATLEKARNTIRNLSQEERTQTLFLLFNYRA